MYRIISICFTVFLVLFASINLVAASAINESVQTIGFLNNPPKNTQIDTKLSEYYNVPVASGSNGTYLYVAQSWHTPAEIVNLSTNIQIYGTSEYSDFSNNKISMPVNPLLIAVFIGIMYCISNRIE